MRKISDGQRFTSGRRQGAVFLMAVFVLLGAALLLRVPKLLAEAQEPCAKADARLAATGRGDRDHDGLSNCAERKILGTDPGDFDSDDDGEPDGSEVADGTDPSDGDSDDDGLDDGEENDAGTDPVDADSDDDGTPDGDDADPGDELKSEIAGSLQAITCPTAEAAGSLTVLGFSIALTSDTQFEGGEGCADLAARFAANGGAQVEVEVSGEGCSGLVATEVESEDADNDGSPDETDEDDDNDGISDDDDEGEDGQTPSPTPTPGLN